MKQTADDLRAAMALIELEGNWWPGNRQKR